jgi:nicotinate-nucleotide adenylyltransferase
MKPIHTKNRTIGLLGGSFNPAHGGHLHITLYALNKLGLDEVWWLVSPRNPLKSTGSLAQYEQRLQSAEGVARPYKRIKVLDIERRYNTHYSYETIDLLKSHYPGTRFVWLIGADNLAQFHRWRRWQWLLSTIPIVVFDRTPYSHTSLRSKAMLRGRKFLLKNSQISSFGRVPALAFIHLRRDPLSSSDIRKKLGEKAFLGHNRKCG